MHALQHDLISTISSKTLLPHKVTFAGLRVEDVDISWRGRDTIQLSTDSTHPNNPPEATTTPSKTSLSKVFSAHVVPSQGASCGTQAGNGVSVKANTITREKYQISVIENDRFVEIKTGENEYVFDKSYGRIKSIKRKGTELLDEPTRLQIWHAPCYNRGSADAWYDNNLHKAYQKTYYSKVTKTENAVEIETSIAFGGPASPSTIKGIFTYVFNADGTFKVKASGTVKEVAPLLPRFGIELILKEENEKLRYFGLGFTETYPDRYKSARFGEYDLTVTDNFVHYVRPQENSSHYKTRRVDVGETGGVGIRVTPCDETKDFSFNASHYSAEQLTETTHDFELRKEPRTILNIDWRFNAISENEELNTEENKRLLNDKEFKFSFMFEPIDM